MQSRYQALVDTLAGAIYAGQLLPGTQLPTHRTLARSHHISLATATRVYAQLAAMGLVSGETGRGTFVREWNSHPGQGASQSPVPADILDLNFNAPILPAQSDMLRQALRQLASSGHIDSLLNYQPHAGRSQDRLLFSRFLACRQLHCAAGAVHIVTGAQHGLAVTLMSLFKPGDVLAVDSLSYPGFLVLARQCHLELVAVPVTDTGPDLNALEALCARRNVKAFYTMPTMHNPMNWVMTHEDRTRLAQIARTRGMLIIEDAAYAWLATHAPAPLYQYCPEKTVYITGFSKNIAAGMRVGLVVAPEDKSSAITHAIHTTQWNTPALSVCLVAGWIQDGTLARLERQKRDEIRERQRLAREIFAGLTVNTHPEACYLWLPLGENVRDDRVVSALLQEGVAVSSAAPFCSTPARRPHAIRVALTSVARDQLAKGLKIVRDVIRDYSDR